METGLVSIVMPSYNCSAYIIETVHTVIAQTYNNWELIIVDDCSTDDTIQIIEKFVQMDRRIRYIELEKNSGAAIARNTGIAASKGEYIAFLDSDDLWMEDKLQKQVAFMKKKGCAFSFTSYSLIDENGNAKNKMVLVPEKMDYNRVLYDTPIFTSTVMYDKNIIPNLEMPIMKRGQDVATWLKILKMVDYAYGIKENLAIYRIRDNSLSTGIGTKLKRRWRIYRECEQIGLLKSCWLYIKYLLFIVQKRKKA